MAGAGHSAICLSHGVPSTPLASVPPAGNPTLLSPKLPPIRGRVGNSQAWWGARLHGPSLSLSLQTPEDRAPSGVTERSVAKAHPSSPCLSYRGSWKSWGSPSLFPPGPSWTPQTSLTGRRLKCPDHVPSHSSNLPSSPPDRVLGSWGRDKVRGQGCWGKPWAP